MRQPAWSYSTEAFESLYGETRPNFEAGTLSVGKQIMEVFFGKELCSHKCRKSRKIRIRDSETANQNDTMIIDKNDNFYKIISIDKDEETGDQIATCWPILLTEYRAKDTPDLDFADVGVFCFDTYDQTKKVAVRSADVKGKLIRVGNRGDYIVTCPKEWLLGLCACE